MHRILREFEPSFEGDANGWRDVEEELSLASAPIVLWCWDAFEPGPDGIFDGKWPIETRPFVALDEEETTRRGLPTIDLFLYSDPSPRLFTDLRKAYGDDRHEELRGNTVMFRDRRDETVVTLTEMLPLSLPTIETSADVHALAASLSWSHPNDHERFLFSLLRVETSYDHGSAEEEHFVLYTPLPPRRVVELVLPRIAAPPTYVLDCERGGWWEQEGPGRHGTMGDWVAATAPRFIVTPSAKAEMGRWRERSNRPFWPWVRGEPVARPKVFEVVD